MKRAAVFAHYDKDSVIDDYVIYYLNGLKEVAQTIVFVSCCDLPVEEISKLNGIVSYVIAEKHDEYDFGSYKRGFLYLKDRLNEFDELIFANDSCYGPLYPLDKVFSKMENEVCDFWGITKNNYGYKKRWGHFLSKRPHIQSYFIVLRKNIFTQDFFTDFMRAIKHEKIKQLIITKYEIGLTELLVSRNYTYKVLINVYANINNIAVFKWRQLIENYNLPFMKCSLPRLVNVNSTTVEGWQEIIQSVSNYPVEIIEKNVKRTKVGEYRRYSLPKNVKRMYFDILPHFPFVLRKLISIFVKRCFPVLRD